MKNFTLILFTFLSFNVYSMVQLEVGVAAANEVPAVTEDVGTAGAIPNVAFPDGELVSSAGCRAPRARPVSSRRC